ncbi:MAG: RCC1 domain-containing protein [Gemmatimonadota bacterium]|nr:RCC1 domain-containing protein [Gemmatimonadota bacterium]
MSVGTGHSCGVRTDGTITRWGLNEFGETDAP